MNKELILAIEALEKENGIDKEIMFDGWLQYNAGKKQYEEGKAEFDKADNGRVVLDRRTGDFHIYSDRTVVEEVEVPEFLDTKKGKYVSGTEIALADARKIKPGCQLGDVITIEVKSEQPVHGSEETDRSEKRASGITEHSANGICICKRIRISTGI